MSKQGKRDRGSTSKSSPRATAAAFGLRAAAGAGKREALPRALFAAKERLAERLLLHATEAALTAHAGTDAYGFENVVGVAVGHRVVGGRETQEPCVTVYVVAKEPPERVTAEAMIPSKVDGVTTDVVAVGELRAQPFVGRYRPAPGGSSVGHYRITAGTLGCLARRGGTLYILSNNHVLANSNNANAGDAIVQPGPYDGGRVPQDVIAQLSQWIPLRFGGPVNQADCAIAQTSADLVSAAIHVIGRISSTPLPAVLQLPVKKSGRTTQFTRGRVTGINATVRVGYGSAGVALFQNQIIIQSVTNQPFSQPGDSGSLVVSEFDNRPVGLLFAGSTVATIATPIDVVLRLLNIGIVA